MAREFVDHVSGALSREHKCCIEPGVQRHGHIKVKKTVPQAVAEMLEVRAKDGTSNAYIKVLKGI